jgi:hypothetical protein
MSNQTKRTLLSLIGLGVFLLLAFGSEYSTNKNSSTSNNNNSAKEVQVSSKNGTTFTNTKYGLSGKLEENYVDFSFTYPSSWKRDPDAGGESPNFVKVENATQDGITIENFAVGYCSGPLSLMPGLAAKLSEQFENGGNFPEYKKVSEGATKVAGLDAYEFRFTGHSSKTAKELDIWGRAVLLPSTSSRKGAVLIMLGSSAGPILHSVDDVGEKGELPTILNSFKFGS